MPILLTPTPIRLQAFGVRRTRFILFSLIIEGSLEAPPLSRHSYEPNAQRYSEGKPSPAGVSMPGVLASIYVRALDSETQPYNKRSKN
jgi:hypothetical protein